MCKTCISFEMHEQSVGSKKMVHKPAQTTSAMQTNDTQYINLNV